MSDATSIKERAQPVHTRRALPDKSISPPPLPPAYKTLLYPACTDKLTSIYPAEMQMRFVSLNWKSGEQAMLKSSKRSDQMKIRESNQHINRYCETCYEFTPGGDINIKYTLISTTHPMITEYRLHLLLQMSGKTKNV